MLAPRHLRARCAPPPGHAALVAKNEASALVRRLPSEAEVARWVAEAKTLPRIVTH